ncbi:MAG: hypothetical protein GY861_17795 [bacterium]|nr:hypothetical protein [bacterium]
MSEAAFTADFKNHLKDIKKTHGKSFFFYKVSDRYTSGIPDFYIAFRGLSAHIELKDKGKEPSDIQYHQMKRMQQAGLLAVWFDSLECACEFVDELVSKRVDVQV